jgi:hypothetical protein
MFGLMKPQRVEELIMLDLGTPFEASEPTLEVTLRLEFD